MSRLEIDATVNAADDIGRRSVFLTVTGTSAEGGDDGEVGRGNRVSGLITPYRPMTLEASAGKNPVSHVGKLYSLAAARIADAMRTDVEGVTGAECVLVSQIGRAVSDPQVVDICFDCEKPSNMAALTRPIGEIVRCELEHLSDLRKALLEERIPVF